MKIVDAFMFFHEFDILESRLQYLYDHVDYFVIIESNRSFVGNPKPLHFLEKKDRYTPYLDKIIYSPFLLSQTEFEKYQTNDLTSTKTGPWRIEKAQRDYVAESVKMFDDQDIILISDADEIPNIDCINYSIKPYYQNDKDQFPMLLLQEYLVYNLERKYVIPGTNYGWFLPFVTQKKYLKKYKADDLRGFTGTNDFPKRCFYNGGWHLHCFMPAEDIIAKLQNFSHTEYLSNENQSSEILNDWVKKDLHYIGGTAGHFEYVTREYYPTQFLQIFEKYFEINKRS